MCHHRHHHLRDVFSNRIPLCPMLFSWGLSLIAPAFQCCFISRIMQNSCLGCISDQSFALVDKVSNQALLYNILQCSTIFYNIVQWRNFYNRQMIRFCQWDYSSSCFWKCPKALTKSNNYGISRFTLNVMIGLLSGFTEEKMFTLPGDIGSKHYPWTLL